MVGHVLDGEQYGGNELVLAVDNACIEPPGVDDVDLQALPEIDSGPAAAGTEQGASQEQDEAAGCSPHARYSRTLAPQSASGLLHVRFAGRETPPDPIPAVE